MRLAMFQTLMLLFLFDTLDYFHLLVHTAVPISGWHKSESSDLYLTMRKKETTE